eukprot:TRINITY_DN806_c0_g1_i7.p1 TRINITY_DN806_c0_g1~~TRINITY_DN806_c0_g1_i7.p1  ORF type:complete len:243 (-),score=-26.96 TRINITY_DN806_c0_g1_i7:244-972(-)
MKQYEVKASVYQYRSAQPLTGLTLPTYQTGSLPDTLFLLQMGYLILEAASRLDAFSGYPFRTWLPSLCIWRHNWYTSGASTPVLSYQEQLSSNTLRPWWIGTELSHDVLNPAHVPLQWANRPTLGTCYSPRMRRADIEVPNLPVAVNAWERSACYPRSTFYLMSHDPSTQDRGVTMSCFRTCSRYLSRSQAPFYHYTLRTVTNRTEGTFELLRYSLGGDRPSQTTQLALFPALIQGSRLDNS